jgi:hypothetical protein
VHSTRFYAFLNPDRVARVPVYVNIVRLKLNGLLQFEDGFVVFAVGVVGGRRFKVLFGAFSILSER